MKILIVGEGKPLYFLCRNFSARGYSVVIISRNPEECVRLAQQLTATVICGDGSDPGILQDAGAMGADIVLAVTPNDQDNLIICQLASLQFGVPRSVALANDPDNVDVFEKLGVTVFSTTHIVAGLIEERASLEQITNLFPVGNGRVNITEIILDEKSPAAGKCLKDMALPENSLVAVVIRSDQPIIPRGPSKLMSGDRVVLITLPENHGQTLKAFAGDE